MRKLLRIATLFAVALITVGCDQATKAVAQNHLSASAPLVYLNGMVRLEYAENPGAFLSLGAGMSEAARGWIFIVGIVAILTGVLIFALMKIQKFHVMTLVALGLVLGAGVGNVLDRLLNQGRVVDFLNVGIGGLRTGIFNVADMALMAGILLIAVFSYRQEGGLAGDEARSLVDDGVE